MFFLIHSDRRIVSVKIGLFFQEITFILDSQVAIFCYQYFKQVANGIFRWQICYLLLLISNPAHGLNRVGTTRLVTIIYSNLLITRSGINCQMGSKFGNIVHFALELLALECLKSSYLTLSLT